MKRDLRTALIGMVAFTVLLGLVYPLAVTGVSQLAFPGDANGQRVYAHGELVGSRIIGQSFVRPALVRVGGAGEAGGALATRPDPRYFQTRPSAAEGGADNAAASASSDRGPNSVKTRHADEAAIRAYLALNGRYDPGLTVAKIPVDAINTSASGLDPEISPANAWIQAHRVAAVRRVSLATVDGLIARHTSGRGLGFSGEPGVNVLELNIALDRLLGQNRASAKRGSRKTSSS
jgi:potassium-transporting ATPase KdpC subunit